jgi:mannose-6-phosphate isomerase-like protein (cupin superfamily)
MRTFDSRTAALAPEFGIMCGRWSQYPALDSLPFDSMWCFVPPGSRTDEDCHPEAELVVVLDGEARLESPQNTVDASPGTAVLLGSRERHVIHNRSEGSPLVLLSIYWMPDGLTEERPDAR